MEANPNHPVTKDLHDQWHKIAGLLMLKLGVKKVSISAEDVEAFRKLYEPDIPVVVVHAHEKSIDLLMMPEKEALEYAKKNP